MPSKKTCITKGAEIPAGEITKRMCEFRRTVSPFAVVNGLAGLIEASYTRDQLRTIAKQLGITGRSRKWDMCWKIAGYLHSADSSDVFAQLTIITKGS